MNWVTKIFSGGALSGYHTYIVAAAGMVAALAAYLDKGMDLQAFLTAEVAGLATITGRAGLAKVEALLQQYGPAIEAMAQSILSGATAPAPTPATPPSTPQAPNA